MNLQQQMEATLKKTGIPAKSIQCYGRQIVITSESQKAASKWAAVLTKFCKSVKTIESTDYAKVNKGTCLLPTTVKVFRTFSTM